MERTTLTIPKEFRETLNQYKGQNDMERLKKWSKNQKPEKQRINTEQEIKEICKEVCRNMIREKIKPNALN